MKFKFFHYPRKQLRDNIVDTELLAIQSGSMVSCLLLALFNTFM